MRIPLHNPEIAGGVRSEQHSTATAVLSDRHEQQLLPSPGGLNASDVNREQGSGRNAAARDVGLDVEDGERWRYRLGIGSKLDVEDTVLRWCEASVVEVDDVRAAVFVTYTYWAREVREEHYMSTCTSVPVYMYQVSNCFQQYIYNSAST